MKGERIGQIQLLLLAHTEGLRKAEIARRIGVHRSTIGRCLDDLSSYIDIYEEKGFVKLRNNAHQEGVHRAIFEKIALNDFSEILKEDKALLNEPTMARLRSVASDLRQYAPTLSNTIMQLVESSQEKEEEQTQDYREILFEAWSHGDGVKIKTCEDGKKNEIEIIPYFLGFKEEAKEKKAISVTGRLRHTDEMVTIDTATIIEVTIVEQMQTISDNLKPFKRPDYGNNYPLIDSIHLSLKIKEKSALNVFRKLNTKDMIVEEFEGYSLITMDVENSTDLFLKLVQCGTSVEVLGPANFRSLLITRLDGILSLYQ